MGVYTSFDQVGKVIAKQTAEFSSDMVTLEASGNRTVAAAVVSAVAANLGGVSIIMSGVGKNGRRVGVVATPGTQKSMVVKMTGPAHLIERDTDPHLIMGKGVGRLGKGKGSRSKEAKYKAKQELYDVLFGGASTVPMRVGRDWRMGPFQHPGTTGKHPFERGVNVVRPTAPRVYQRGVNVAMRKAFRG
jgi:hypothetical protein